MKKMLCMILLCTMLFGLTACGQPSEPTATPDITTAPSTTTPAPSTQPDGSSFYGSWIVGQSLSTTAISALSPADADAFEGTVLTYDEAQASLYGEIYNRPVYLKNTLTAASFEETYKGITFADLGIRADEVLEVMVESSTVFGCHLFLEDGKPPIIYYEGVFFKTAPHTAGISSTDPVPAQVQLYEGCYFDERVYGYASMPESESPLVYCEIWISNITDTSFDFEIKQITMATGDAEEILPRCTAIFTGDGTQAIYQTQSIYLTFRFPDQRQSAPVVVDLQVDGLDLLDGNTYVNNAIPGHEFG